MSTFLKTDSLNSVEVMPYQKNMLENDFLEILSLNSSMSILSKDIKNRPRFCQSVFEKFIIKRYNIIELHNST